VVQDEPPLKKGEEERSMSGSPLIVPKLAKKCTNSIGSTPYFTNIKGVFI
jgi:hypothetical protein